MKLTDKQKKQIEEELTAFTNEYAGKTKEERKAKGQFFTPASLVIEMLEMFDCEELLYILYLTYCARLIMGALLSRNMCGSSQTSTGLIHGQMQKY